MAGSAGEPCTQCGFCKCGSSGAIERGRVHKTPRSWRIDLKKKLFKSMSVKAKAAACAKRKHGQLTSNGLSFLDCPICMETFSGSIFQCADGHTIHGRSVALWEFEIQ
jgi:hypothetical protein